MSKSYSAEIIAVGTELLLGQIANTNAQWLSEKLADIGINVFFHSVVGDNLDRVYQVFKQAAHRSDIVLVTGGLGPTEDDLTREAFQKMTNLDMIEDKSSMEKIESFYRQANRKMTSNNRKQSLVFKGSTVYMNQVGMAPGMGISVGEVQWYFMPGVPREMKSIMEESIIPSLRTTFDLTGTIKSRMLRFIGIGESQLEHDLKPLIGQQSNPTIAPLASEGEVGVRVTAKAENENKAIQLIDELEKQILQIAGKFFFGYDDESLAEKVVQSLNNKGLKIGVAESLTGGKFADAIVSIPGASKVFNGSIIAYKPEMKVNMLEIRPQLIESDGTVSESCAREMAANGRRVLDVDIALSFTGVAGPYKEEGKPVGTVYIGLCTSSGVKEVHQYHFSGDRESIRNRAVKKGIEMLWNYLK